jgi:hypothetical protein
MKNILFIALVSSCYGAFAESTVGADSHAAPVFSNAAVNHMYEEEVKFYGHPAGGEVFIPGQATHTEDGLKNHPAVEARINHVHNEYDDELKFYRHPAGG